MKRTILYSVIALLFVRLVDADQTVQSVQQALKDQGFYYGNVTGDKSAETTSAIRRYQIRNGLQVTGDIDPETLRSLNVNSNSASLPQTTSNPAITRSNSNIILSWPTSQWNFVPQQNADLRTTNWTTLTNTPNVQNGQNMLTLPASGSNRFYRLVH